MCVCVCVHACVCMHVCVCVCVCTCTCTFVCVSVGYGSIKLSSLVSAANHFSSCSYNVQKKEFRYMCCSCGEWLALHSSLPPSLPPLPPSLPSSSLPPSLPPPSLPPSLLPPSLPPSPPPSLPPPSLPPPPPRKWWTTTWMMQMAWHRGSPSPAPEPTTPPLWGCPTGQENRTRSTNVTSHTDLSIPAFISYPCDIKLGTWRSGYEHSCTVWVGSQRASILLLWFDKCLSQCGHPLAMYMYVCTVRVVIVQLVKCSRN